MLLWLLLAILLHLASLGTLGEPCGETVQIHTLTQTSPQHAPTYISSNVTWTYMVIHIHILTMAAPREDPPRDPRGDPPREPRDPDRPVPAPRAIQLSSTHPLTGRGTPMNSSRPLGKGQRYSWRAHMKIIKNQTRL